MYCIVKKIGQHRQFYATTSVCVAVLIMDLILNNEDLGKNSSNNPVVYVIYLGCRGNFRPLKMDDYFQPPPTLSSDNLVHLSSQDIDYAGPFCPSGFRKAKKLCFVNLSHEHLEVSQELLLKLVITRHFICVIFPVPIVTSFYSYAFRNSGYVLCLIVISHCACYEKVEVQVQFTNLNLFVVIVLISIF